MGALHVRTKLVETIVSSHNGIRLRLLIAARMSEEVCISVLITTTGDKAGAEKE